jgi:hypothetical protein
MQTTDVYSSGAFANRNPTYHVEESPWKARQILKMLARHDLKVGSVCEIGCGAGEILRQLQLSMPKETVFHGYDTSPYAIELCRQRENDSLHFHMDDLTSKDIQPFDLLLCVDVVEHVEDYIGFLRKLRTKAVYKIFHIPLELGVYMVLRSQAFVNARKNVGHLHSFTRETAFATLNDTGYTILDWFYTPSAIDNPFNRIRRLIRVPHQILTLINDDFSVRLLGGYELLVLTE